MEAKDVYKVAQIMLAAESKKRTKNLVDNMRNESYQRTFTDEYPFVKKARSGFQKVADEQKKAWSILANLK